jgi:soluble lytic murein transglycosylase-like protein
MKAIPNERVEDEVVDLPLRGTHPQPVRSWSAAVAVVVVLLNLALVGTLLQLSRHLLQSNETFRDSLTSSLKDELSKQAVAQATELEQLRSAVVLTTTENNLLLKIMLLKPGIDRSLAREIAHSVSMRAKEHHRDPDLALSVIAIESDFNPNAVSSAGAVGLMQIMPMWKPMLNIEHDLRHVDTSISNGLKILAFYERRYQTLEMALTAYNKGEVQMDADLKAGRNPSNGYAESIMKAYARIKAWTR